MRCKVKIRNQEQLHCLAGLFIDTNWFNKLIDKYNITFSIDIPEILNNAEFIVSGDNDILEFFSPSLGGKVYSYIRPTKTIIEHVNGKETNYKLEEDMSIDGELNNEEQAAAEGAFLLLIEFDVSKGWLSKDIEHHKRAHPELYFAMFGLEL